MSDAAIRVLLVLENAGAGSGRHVIDLARGLLARGDQVTLAYSRSRLEGWFANALSATPKLRTVRVDMRPGLGPADAVAIRNVRRYIKSYGPFDVIHGHSSKAGALVRLSAQGLPGARVYTPHAFYTLGSRTGSPRSRFYGAIERFLARLSDGIICVSRAEHRHALHLGLPADKLFVVPNGLQPLPKFDRHAVRQRLGLDDEHVCVGFVGRLARQKAVHRLIDAFVPVHASHPAARLAIVGDGPDADILKARAAAAGIQDVVIWTGAASGIELMSAFDIFALPSLYEAFPYVLLEALASGLPVVSARVGGVDELVHDDRNGFVVEQDDTTGLATRINQLIGDAPLRDAMARASTDVVANFDTATMVTDTSNVYRALLQRLATSAPRRLRS